MKTRSFLKQLDHERIVAAIHAAEQKTTGHIRVVVSRRKTGNALAAAGKEFIRLRMSHHQPRNAVLIFISPPSRAFAVVGDQAIHERCGETAWKEITQSMAANCRERRFGQAILDAIDHAGNLLGEHFPRPADETKGSPASDHPGKISP